MPITIFFMIILTCSINAAQFNLDLENDAQTYLTRHDREDSSDTTKQNIPSLHALTVQFFTKALIEGSYEQIPGIHTSLLNSDNARNIMDNYLASLGTKLRMHLYVITDLRQPYYIEYQHDDLLIFDKYRGYKADPLSGSLYTTKKVGRIPVKLPITPLVEHELPLDSFVSPHGAYLATSNRNTDDNTTIISIFALEEKNYRLVSRLIEHNQNDSVSVLFSADERYIIIIPQNDHIHLVDMKEEKTSTIPIPIIPIASTFNNGMLYLFGSDGSSLWLTLPITPEARYTIAQRHVELLIKQLEIENDLSPLSAVDDKEIATSYCDLLWNKEKYEHEVKLGDCLEQINIDHVSWIKPSDLTILEQHILHMKEHEEIEYFIYLLKRAREINQRVVLDTKQLSSLRTALQRMKENSMLSADLPLLRDAIQSYLPSALTGIPVINPL